MEEEEKELVWERERRESKADSSLEYLLMRIQVVKLNPPLGGKILPPSPTPLVTMVMGALCAVDG